MRYFAPGVILFTIAGLIVIARMTIQYVAITIILTIFALMCVIAIKRSKP